MTHQSFQSIRNDVNVAAWRMTHHMIEYGLVRVQTMRPTRTGILLCGARLEHHPGKGIVVMWDRDRLLHRTSEAKDADGRLMDQNAYDGPKTVQAEPAPERDVRTTEDGVSFAISAQEGKLLDAGHLFEGGRDRNDRAFLTAWVKELSRHYRPGFEHHDEMETTRARAMTIGGRLYMTIFHLYEGENLATAHALDIDGGRATVSFEVEGEHRGDEVPARPTALQEVLADLALGAPRSGKFARS